MGWIARNHPLFDSATNSISDASPFSQLGIILQTGFADPSICYQVISDVAAGLFFYMLAWLVFDRVCRRDTDAAPGRGLVFRNTRLPGLLKAGRTWRSALFWKDFHFMAGGKLGMLIKFTLLTLLVAYFYNHMIEGRGKVQWQEFGWVITDFMGLILALELSVGAGRIFRTEITSQTLSSIALLPISTRSLVYRKAMGYLLAAIPTIFYFALGLILVIANSDHMPADETFNMVMVFILLISLALLLVHIVAYLSLILKRAALPLGIGIVFIGNMFGLTMMGLMFRGGGPNSLGGLLFLITVGVLAITMGFHAGTAARVRRAAAEE